MSIADKSITLSSNNTIIAENQQKVYDSGYNRGESAGYRTGHSVGYVEGETAGYNRGYKEGEEAALDKGGYTEGFDAGKQAEYDAFWDAYQQNGARGDYQYGGFGGNGWDDNSYKPKYTPKPVHAYNMFQGCYITEITNVDFSTVNSIGGTFAYSSKLKKIGKINPPNLTDCTNAFRLCPKLETIELLKLNENTKINTQTFDSLPELKNVTIEGNINGSITLGQSTKLTKDSITSIINALWSGSSGKTLTLSKTAVDTAWAWEDWDGSMRPGSTDGLWLELRDSKSNWTITLV